MAAKIKCEQTAVEILTLLSSPEQQVDNKVGAIQAALTWALQDTRRHDDPIGPPVIKYLLQSRAPLGVNTLALAVDIQCEKTAAKVLKKGTYVCDPKKIDKSVWNVGCCQQQLHQRPQNQLGHSDQLVDNATPEYSIQYT
jgi:hypothetical protein